MVMAVRSAGSVVPAGRLAPAGGATTWYCVAPST